jgi:hypothetical protein
MRPNLPFVSAKHTLVAYNITLSLITKTNQGPRCFQRQHKMLNINALRPLKHYLPEDLMNFGRRP